MQLANTPITPEPCPRILAEQTLVIRPRSPRGNRSLYERYNVHDPNAMREKMYKEKWELGYFYHRISLSSPRGRGRPAPRLLRCSGLSRCSCLLLLPRFNPFGLPNWSPLRISYGKENQIQDEAFHQEITHWKRPTSENRAESYRCQDRPRPRSTESTGPAPRAIDSYRV